MKISGKILLVAAGTLIAMPAQASDKQDFEACDGRIHPGKQDDGMRSQAGTSGYGYLLREQGNVAAACTRALASPRLLPTQSLRKAHLLRARAAAYLEANDSEKALADLDLAESAAAGLSDDRFYQRSMAVSIKLLRALAYARSGDLDRAVPLAQEAMQARPYALQVQQAGAEILQAARPIGVPSPSPWRALARLKPDVASAALINEADIGNFAGVLALRPGVSLTWPTKPVPLFALMSGRSEEGQQFLLTLITSLHIAYARAAAGDAEGAANDLRDVREHVAALRALPTEQQAANPFNTSANSQIDGYVDVRARLIEARIAVAEGRPNDAIGTLVSTGVPRDAAAMELLMALKAAVAAKDAGLVPDATPIRESVTKRRLDDLGKRASTVLIAPETPRAVIDYGRSRPDILTALVGGALSLGTSLLGGINRTDGFRSTVNADGTTKVEFIGNTPSAALVQEMTLLRAAEVTRATGKTCFVIVDRKDFSRTLNTSRGGVPISSVPTGYKTELTIRYVDSVTDTNNALDAVTIIDALGPLYYEADRTKS